MLFDRVAQSDNSTRSAAHFPLDSQTPFTGSSKGPYLVPRTELLVGTPGDRAKLYISLRHYGTS
jgi:hypothetical protein